MQEPIEIDPPVWAAPEATDIYQAISRIYASVGYVQKQRAKENAGGYRGLDYTYASESGLIQALRPALVAQGVIMHIAEYADLARFTVPTAKGGLLNVTTLRAVVRFTHAASGTYIDVQALGEGADSGDKSSNKAMTCAFKYALRQTFAIETGDDPDKDQNNEYQQPTTQTAPAPKAKTPQSQLAKLLSDARMSTTVDQCRSFYASAQKMGATALELGEIQTLAKELAAIGSKPTGDKPFSDSELGGK